MEQFLKEGTSVPQILSRLQAQETQAGRLSALEHGALVQAEFPALAANTLALAEQAMQGMLVLPGTGPALHFVGTPVAWTENPVNDNEYTFHLNRMHHVKTLCEAYSLTGNTTYSNEAVAQVSHWIDTVPCPSLTDQEGAYQLTVFEGLTPWRALEVGIRGYRTWPFVLDLLANSGAITPIFLEKLLRSVQQHATILYTISPLLWPKADHNHYLMENLGLLSFACLFPELKDSTRWKTHALHELSRCLEAQVTPDGGQIEGCPSYHNGCVFWFSLPLVLARKYQFSVGDSYQEKLRRMFLHSLHATRSCGGNFPWGDSHTYKETLCLAAVACYMAFGDAAFLSQVLSFYSYDDILQEVQDNLWRITDISTLATALHQLKRQPLTGIPTLSWQRQLHQVYLRSGWEKESISLMTGCRTPIANRHAHMDAGGFDLVAYGAPLVSDPGIFTYKDDENRYWFKSSQSHNCVTINKKDMWEYQGSWSYGPQKEGKMLWAEQTKQMSSCISRHKNYEPVMATRALALVDERFVLVVDVLEGLSVTDVVDITFHLDFEQTHVVIADSKTVYSARKNAPNILLASSTVMKQVLEAGRISTASNVAHNSTLVRLETTGVAGRFIHATLLLPFPTPIQERSYTHPQVSHRGNSIVINCTVNERVYQWELKDDQLLLL